MITTVQNVQTALNLLGYATPPLAVDGVAGPLTQAATRSFQTDHSLTVDGIAGPETKAALVAALANSGDPQAQALIAQDNASPPTNTTAVHLPPTPSTPAMTLITKGNQRTTAPYGTPSSPVSALAKTTGATPNATAPLSTKVAGMTTTEKVVGGSVLAGAAYWLYKKFGKGGR